MTAARKPCKADCSGCRDDFYNHRTNFDGKSECWSLKDAKFVMRKEVHVDQRPPWNQKPIRVPDCFRRPRHVYVDPGRTN